MQCARESTFVTSPKLHPIRLSLVNALSNSKGNTKLARTEDAVAKSSVRRILSSPC